MQGVGQRPAAGAARASTRGASRCCSPTRCGCGRAATTAAARYLDLLRRLAHWLMKEPELEEEALRARANGHDLTIERQSVRARVPQATRDRAGRQDDDRPARAASLPAFRARPLRSIEDGLYRASDGEHVALAVVGPENPLEFQDVVSTPEKLRPLAEATGGSVRRLAKRADDAIDVAALVAMQRIADYAGAGLHRRQTHRGERADRRRADAARRRLPRPRRCCSAR